LWPNGKGVSVTKDGTLYVADSLGNRITAISNALSMTKSGGTGKVISSGGALNGPLGLTLAPNGDLLAVNSGQLYPEDRRTFYAIASQFKIASYFNLGLDPANWRTWLAGKGPILTRLDVDAAWDNASATQSNLDVYQPKIAHGRHAVALVGYTPDRFIVRNSWGSGWGDQGYAYASLAYVQAAFKEAYGVVI
jgi:hypothetical protein